MSERREVIVTNVDIGFWRMVSLMFKGIFASFIAAACAIALVTLVVLVVLAPLGMMSGNDQEWIPK